jgi:nucleolar protein 56
MRVFSEDLTQISFLYNRKLDILPKIIPYTIYDYIIKGEDMLMLTTWFGTFLFENDAVVANKLFPKDPGEIAARLSKVEENGILDEERELVKGSKGFHVLDKRLQPLGGELIEEEMPHLEPSEFGFSNDMLHESMMMIAQKKTQQKIGSDERITQAVNALDDLIQSTNLLSERLHEWWGAHFPKQKMMKEEDFVKFILSEDHRTGLNEDDLAPIMDLAHTLDDMYERKNNLEEYIKVRMDDSANNISHLVGPIIGARLIAKAGTLDRLARLPSGTIQVLGAEKALFRHLKDGANPPKHGFIFQHPLIHRAPYWQRGKIARAFASKIAIAAKLDKHSDTIAGEDLKKDLMERIEEIRERYPKPQKGKRKK